jgi:hypothetical protein
LIIDKKDVTQPIKEIEEKGLALVNILSDGRARIDTYRNEEWKLFLNNITGVDKADWIDKLPNKQIWKKKSSEKISVTKTFKLLLTKTQSLNCLSIGAKDIPICLLSKQQTNDICSLLVEIYKSEVIINFVKKINKSMPLLIIWITGFKPRGDDSRPDRGLLPLARMLFGNDINILSIVYGPAKTNTWEIFYKNPGQLSLDNGLWQAVMGLSDFVLADSITSKYGILTYLSNRNKKIKPKEIKFKGIKKSVIFSEHDIDTSIHSIFTRVTRERIFESMCNPPGGDWSGISYYNFDEEKEYRWTSLPRVSADKAKRPDHIIQIDSDGDIIFLVIESKNYASNLEENIGIRLKSYINTLFNILPTAIKKSNKNWELYSDKNIPIKKKIIFSGGAYIYRSSEELKRSLEDGKLDFILAFEYFDYNSPAILHICVIKECRFLLPMISSLCERFGNGVKIQVH